MSIFGGLGSLEVGQSESHQVLPVGGLQAATRSLWAEIRRSNKLRTSPGVAEVVVPVRKQLLEKARGKLFQLLVRLIAVLPAQGVENLIQLRAGVILEVEILVEAGFQTRLDCKKRSIGPAYPATTTISSSRWSSMA